MQVQAVGQTVSANLAWELHGSYTLRLVEPASRPWPGHQRPAASVRTIWHLNDATYVRARSSRSSADGSSVRFRVLRSQREGNRVSDDRPSASPAPGPAARRAIFQHSPRLNPP